VDPRTQRPRIADVAREAGVSKTAVSFAFNSPERLAPQTAIRIREVADHLGYRPHPVARMLTQRQTMTIGVLTPQALSVIFSNPFFGEFSEGVALAAEGSGYGLHFISPVRGSLARAMSQATVDRVGRDRRCGRGTGGGRASRRAWSSRRAGDRRRAAAPGPVGP
jgi:alanine racemase